MKRIVVHIPLISLALGLFIAPHSQAQPTLLAIGNLDQSPAGSFADLSGLTDKLENGVPANLLGGIGSGLAYASGNTFLAVPDRGPNAIPYNPAIDNTTSYITRFHTVTMDLVPNTTGGGLPFTLTPQLRATTLLWSLTPLVYSSGSGLGIGSGVPPINNFILHFFTGRSDNYAPNRDSSNPNNARFDPEGIRLSNDGWSVFITDEYGPYVYQFDRLTGLRIRTFHLPAAFYVANPRPVETDEIAANITGRTTNKGMEGLAITPDGRTLVGIMQAAMLQDANAGADKLLRIVTIDIASGLTHQYAYLLTTGKGASDILALNDHEFLVDERDGKGRGDGSKAKVKQLFKIDLAGAVDISAMDATTAATHAVAKTLFFDIVAALTANGIAADDIPAKIEGVAFGPDVKQGDATLHTLWIASDNDFLDTIADANGNPIPNPNQIFVFGVTEADLAGSQFVPQHFRCF